MLKRTDRLLVRVGGISSGMHSVRASQLPYQPWSFDSRYCGLIAQQVIDRFKTKSFPVYSFPQIHLNRKVEEINALAEKGKLACAVKAMALLNDSKYHNDKKQIR